jgi:adenylate cyclase
LIEKLLQDPERLRLGGQRRELTVLFSDIRNFSRFSEKLEPDVLSDLLNEYLTPMTDIVMDNSGMLDKYIGDAVMAVYGAPVPLDDHAERACESALLMLKKLGPLNEFWSKEGLPEIKIGIGINTGPMSVGNMGSQARFDYTVMGDSVNLGARLESLTKTYKVGVLVGEATQKAAEARFIFREIDSVRVIGRSASARVYQLCGSKDDSPFTEDDLALFQRGLDAYRDREWQESTECFDRFLQEHPEDGPAQTLGNRIASLKAQDLGPDWDGVYEQSNK